ncbi:YicC/YloC family endoribonuclease [Leadbetterella sp. DM7]|uniref:YicC/YloC family endoribonuclease n=1 Tax=Leadbetterella sp. DM7 TaxID=3235085 RepID=UPI00349EDF77
MLQSMTGFGSVQKETAKQTLSVEIKTLNSKFTDIYCRLPKSLSSREIDIRNLLQKELERGKIDITLTLVPKEDAMVSTLVNRPLVKAYFRDLMQTAAELQFEASPTDVLRMATMMPNAFNNGIQDAEEAEEAWNEVLEVIKTGIEKCREFRIREGQGTKVKFTEYIEIISGLLEQISSQDARRIVNTREKIAKAMGDFVNSENFDKNRFEQELIYYIEKFDISEEKVRLKAHLEYFIKELDGNSNGKKLNFIAQEIGREINTIGSKANDAEIQRLVVQMKDELEKIKEQTSNIL